MLLLGSITLLLFLLLGFLLRWPGVTARPMHGDEAVQAYKTLDLRQLGVYTYDPNDHHGPILYLAGVPFAQTYKPNAGALNAKTWTRLPVLLVGLAIVFSPLLFRTEDELPGLLIAAGLLATSPAMVFYSGMYIHETIYVSCSLLFLGCLYRAAHSRRTAWFIAAGFILGLMISTKETWPLAMVAACCGVAVTLSAEHRTCIRSYIRPSLIAVGIALITALILFSVFFTQVANLVRIPESLLHYGERLTGEGSFGDHRNPWHFYFHRLLFWKVHPGPIFAEPGFVLFLLSSPLFAVPSLRQSRSCTAAAMLAIFGLIQLIVYTAIPYKTPWLALSFMAPLLISAGMVTGAALQYWKAPPLRIGILVPVVAIVLWSISVSRNVTGTFSADVRNPWVYAHTAPDAERLADRLFVYHGLPSSEDRLRIDFYTHDYWPMPWYLRDFEGAAYWTSAPSDEFAPVVITDLAGSEAFGDRLDSLGYQKEYFGLRPEVPLVLYTQADFWEEFLKTRE